MPAASRKRPAQNPKRWKASLFFVFHGIIILFLAIWLPRPTIIPLVSSEPRGIHTYKQQRYHHKKKFRAVTAGNFSRF